MCQSHTKGYIGGETNVAEVKNPGILEGAKGLANKALEGAKKLIGKGLADNLQDTNLLDMFLSNPSQRTHFENLHNAQKKFEYINGLITKHYTDKISAAYQSNNATLAEDLEKEMLVCFAKASQITLGSTPPAKA